jgi:hypothetical protein
VHCLADPVERDWDHVFPESWYPDTTPPNIEKWKVPSCIPCNRAHGVVEDRLLLALAHVLDPYHPGSAGIYEKAKRAISPAVGKNERDRGARSAQRARFLENVRVGDAIPTYGVYPGLHDRWDQPNDDCMAVLIPKRDMDRITEKIVRGITLVEGDMFIEPTYKIAVEASAPYRDAFARSSAELALGPGIVVRRRLFPVVMTILFEIEFFGGQFRSYARVSPRR